METKVVPSEADYQLNNLPNTAEEKVEAKEEAPEEHEDKEWSNPIEFLMTCIGFSVGLGNVWRFPYLCFKNGGAAFIIAMMVILFGVGLPLFFLEITIAQYSKQGPLGVWKIVPLFRGVGFISLLVPLFISIYYNILIAYSFIYAISSFKPNLPWASCDFAWNNALCCSTSVNGSNCTSGTESPARQFFYDYVLNISDGVGDFQTVNWKLVLSLLLCWFLVFLALSKGVQSLGKISYITAIFPYVMIIILVIRGATLDGAGEGIKYYIGQIDGSKLLTIETWTDATSQVYFILGIAQGGLYTLGRHNKFNYNHQRASIFIAVLDAFTGILAGFAIFSVLGYKSKQTNVPVKELAVGGPGLSFIVYPEALSLMPFPWIWCIFFFLMMITIGFGSILSLVECIMNSVAELFPDKINTQGRKMFFRLVICVIFYIVAFPLTTNSSLYIQNLIDEYLSGYPFYIFAFCEAFGLCVLYGIKRLREDIKLMLGFYPNPYWTGGFILAPIITFIVLIVFTIDVIQDPVPGLAYNNYKYPVGAQIIGWFIVVLVICPLPILAVIHIRKCAPFSMTKEYFKKLIQPDPDWKPVIPKEMLERMEKQRVDNLELEKMQTKDDDNQNVLYV